MSHGSDAGALDLVLLQELSRHFGSALDPAALFQREMQTISDRIPITGARLVLGGPAPDAPGRELVFPPPAGPGGETGADAVPAEVLEAALRGGRAATRAARGGLPACVAVPLFVEGRAVGALGLTPKGKGAPSAERLRRFLSLLAVGIAQAVTAERALEEGKQELVEENYLLREELKTQYRFDGVIGVSGRMREVFDTVSRVASSKASVLLIGETGTGKELIAHTIHYNSARANRPFIRVNCGALPEGLLESELFGHVRGAFTGAHRDRKGRFEAAHGGTIFLDEIASMSPLLQVKLLRILQEREFERVGDVTPIPVDARTIAATNTDLEEEIRAGRFREDLYYRLNVIPIRIPPLRERRDDIPLLVEHFLDKYNRENCKAVERIHPDVLAVLTDHPWPGNVRELENTVERAVVLARDREWTPDLLPLNLRVSPRPAPPAGSLDERLLALVREALDAPPNGALPHDTLVSALEKCLIEEALTRTGGVRKEAARILGLHRNTLHQKAKALGIRARGTPAAPGPEAPG